MPENKRGPRDIHCRVCGERKRLRGQRSGAGARRREDEVIDITCLACGAQWRRHGDTCAQCGARAVVPLRVPLVQKARGTQQSVIGYTMAYTCTACGAEDESASRANDVRLR